jgi:hypothetical protein
MSRRVVFAAGLVGLLVSSCGESSDTGQAAGVQNGAAGNAGSGGNGASASGGSGGDGGNNGENAGSAGTSGGSGGSGGTGGTGASGGAGGSNTAGTGGVVEGPVDLCEGLLTDKDDHPRTALAKPPLLGSVTDPAFGTTIRRITDVGGDGVLKPMYSTISAWNADESMMILYEVGGGHHLYDGRTYEYLRPLQIRPADLEQVFWHTSEPDLLFYVDGTELIRYHVSESRAEVVRDFEFCTSGASGGDDVMHMSFDSNVIGLNCGGVAFTYNIAKDEVRGQVNTGRSPQIAPSATLGLLQGDVVDLDVGVLRTLDLENASEHGSLGRMANGHDTFNVVQFGGSPGGTGVGALVVADLTDGSSRVVIGPDTGYQYPPSQTHVSGLAYKQPGWIFVSMVGEIEGREALDGEIVIADTNTGIVCRAVHHRSYGRNGPRGYWAEPHVVPSPSGTRALYGSDWGGGQSVDAYVVELPTYR